MEENNLIEESKQIQLDNEKLMKKSLRMIISFFSLFVICVGLFIYLQDSKFFIFNIDRTVSSGDNPLISEMFAGIFGLIIITGLIVYIIFLVRYIKQSRQDDSERMVTEKSFRRIHSVADMFSIVPIFLVIVMVVNGFFFSFASVNGQSMQPTFCDDDAVIIRYVSPNNYQRDDIVIVHQQNLYLIKRVVGLPGDTLRVDATGVYINDYLVEPNTGSMFLSYQTMTIPDGAFYVLGDNRDNSEDSRLFGLKSSENMIGKVVYRISTTTCPLD